MICPTCGDTDMTIREIEIPAAVWASGEWSPRTDGPVVQALLGSCCLCGTEKLERQ